MNLKYGKTGNKKEPVERPALLLFLYDQTKWSVRVRSTNARANHLVALASLASQVFAAGNGTGKSGAFAALHKNYGRYSQT